MQSLIIIFADAGGKASFVSPALSRAAECVLMALYSLLLAAVFVLGAPYWLVRMATSGRYRAGLSERFGRVPARLRTAASGKKVIWLHAVSVGEVLAATRLVAELESSLGPDWVIVVSTTTVTGQALARDRFAAAGRQRVFYCPLDFAFAVRAYLRVLRPKLFILMESELWPRMVTECRRGGIPIAVVNARVSDRSFARGMKVRGLWRKLLVKPNLFLAQSGEDARRLTAMGANPKSVRVSGNLKYDVRAPKQSRVAEQIRELAAGRPILVAGSTHGRMKNERLSEEEMIIRAWDGFSSSESAELIPLLVLAPRHPQRFAEVEALVAEHSYLKATGLAGPASTNSPDILLLDTIGDLASVYSIADVAFVGGSLVPRGGHNPLEPAQFGVPVVMGPSYENFRDIVERLRAKQAIMIVRNSAELEASLADYLGHRGRSAELGRRAQSVFEQQQGATARTVEALTLLLSAPAEASR
jgi:3-deoxy-D-manno-octulosonic-acid transferase